MPLIVSLTIIGNKFMPYLGVGLWDGDERSHYLR